MNWGIKDMKNAKRIISLLLVLGMSLGIFTGCKKEEDKKVEDGSRTLTVGIPQSTTIPDYDTNAFVVYLKEVTGIDIEWMFFSNNADNYKQQLTLMCTGKEELPDVIIGMKGLSHYVVNQFGEDGYFIDLKDLIEKHAPNYKAQLAKLDKDTQKYIEEKGTNTNDGSFYAMPAINEPTVDDQQSMMFINKTWLDKLGLQVPTNLAELENVCRAFQTQDPNGNGQADEIPMLGGPQLRYWLMNAFIEYNASNFNVKDGKVWDPVVTDEFRQGLIYISDLVKEGLMSELGFTLSSAEMRNMISPTDGPSKVGIFCGHYESMTNASTDALNHYTALGPLADATGKGGYWIVNEPDAVWCNYITKDCKNRELAMEFLDALYADESITRQRHGEKDVDWIYEEGKNAFGTDSYAKIINTQAWFDGSLNKTLNIYFGIITHWNYLPIAQEGEGRVGQASRLARESWNVMQTAKKNPEGTLSGLVYTTGEYELREEKAGTVYSYINQQVVLFTKGEQNARDDKVWNEYKSTLQSLGRDELMKIAQDAYNRKVGK